MEISLVGYMTSGKTVVGKELSELLELPFQDLDESISQAEDMSVPQILRDKGELYFRKVERKILLEELDKDGVLSLGGGTPCYYDNMEVLLKKTFVVYLQWPIRTLVERLRLLRDTRPILDGVSDSDLPEFVAKHVFDRRPFYEQANHIVFCDGKSSHEICKEIIEEWRKYLQI